MKKSLCIAAAALAFMTSQAANAQTFVSTPGTYTFSGTVTVQKGTGPQLNCTLTADIINTSGVLTADNISLTGGFLGLCGTVQFPNTPHSVTVSGPTVTVNSVYIDTTFTPGDCAGNLVATFSSSGGTESLAASGTIPEVDPGTGHCSINGTITWP